VAPLQFIDLFAGIGGMRLGVESLGDTQCVFTCERDRFAVQTYNANFDEDVEPIDITEVTPEEIQSHDLLLAGFPCQPFSLAGVSKKNSLGRRHGFEDATQGTLFFDIARILDAHRPKAFLLENVKNLLSHDRGRTFDTIKRVLHDDLGYTVSFRVLSARPFVPQQRERVFIVGFRDENDFSFDDVVVPPPENWPVLRDILHPDTDDGPYHHPFTTLTGTAHDRYTLSPKLWEYLQAYAQKHRQRGNGFGYGLFGPDDVARTMSARYHKDGAEILIRRPGRNATPRRLTPREAARLMGFETGERNWVIPVSDTRAYRQFGNAVVPQVVESVIGAMEIHLRAPMPQALAA
jgi:DNA (cytosine-5)-methyltransferase 1